MAILTYEDDTESWLTWAIELMRRGLQPVGEITVHGPHQPPADCMWGEASCDDVDGEAWDVSFMTVHGIRRIWDVRNVRVWAKGVWENKVTFPIMPAKDMPDEWRKRLSEMVEERDRLRAQSREAYRRRAELKAASHRSQGTGS